MLAPDDWREWIWSVGSYVGGGPALINADKRLWRATVTATAPGNVRFGPDTIALVSGQVVVIEPKGMYPGSSSISADAGISVVAEFIRKV